MLAVALAGSALIAVCVLAASGVPVEAAWAMVARARGMSVPDTEEQRRWAAEWAAEEHSHPR